MYCSTLAKPKWAIVFDLSFNFNIAVIRLIDKTNFSILAIVKLWCNVCRLIKCDSQLWKYALFY